MIEDSYTRVYAKINLDHVIENMKTMAAGLPEGTRMIAVVKTDGYGHGAVPVAVAVDPFVWGYAVASLEEAVMLKSHGIEKPILVLGVTHESHFGMLIDRGIRPSVFTFAQAKYLSDLAVNAGTQAAVHLAVDTGMGRIGFSPDEEGVKEAVRIAELPGIRVEGLFTHFSKADEAGKAFTELQYGRYLDFVERLEREGIQIPIRHCANSAAIMDLPQMGLDAVRAGISMYGIYPSDEVDRGMKLLPAMELFGSITYIKEVEAGTPISYGGTFTADRRMRVATVGVGYGDGYPRSLSGKGYVLIHGKKAPILGRVCMDQFMVDVTGIPETVEWDRVTLVGRDGDEYLPMELLAELCGGFRYEIPCVLGKRVPRVYIKDGRVIGTKDYFDDVYRGFVPGSTDFSDISK